MDYKIAFFGVKSWEKEIIEREISRLDTFGVGIFKEEVQEVCWLDFKECCKKVKDGDKKYCLFPEELLMIKKYLQFYLK